MSMKKDAKKIIIAKVFVKSFNVPPARKLVFTLQLRVA